MPDTLEPPQPVEQVGVFLLEKLYLFGFIRLFLHFFEAEIFSGHGILFVGYQEKGDICILRDLRPQAVNAGVSCGLGRKMPHIQ